MGLTALIIFLGSLGLGLLCLIIVVWSALGIYKTARYAVKDSRPWIDRFGEFNCKLQETLKAMEQSTQSITRIGLEMRENLEDIQDTWDEISSHPLIKITRFLARLRRP